MFGKPARWIDETAETDGRLIGISLLDHPSNPVPGSLVFQGLWSPLTQLQLFHRAGRTQCRGPTRPSSIGSSSTPVRANRIGSTLNTTSLLRRRNLDFEFRFRLRLRISICPDRYPCFPNRHAQSDSRILPVGGRLDILRIGTVKNWWSVASERGTNRDDTPL